MIALQETLRLIEDYYSDGEYDTHDEQPKSHKLRNAALGLGAGALAGAYLHHRAFKQPTSIGKVLRKHSDKVGQMRIARGIAKRNSGQSSAGLFGKIGQALKTHNVKNANKMYRGAHNMMNPTGRPMKAIGMARKVRAHHTPFNMGY